MNLFYTPTLGMIPENREQMLRRLHGHLVEHGIFTADYNTFLGSNWHRFFSSSVLPMLEDQQAQFVEAQAKLFTFWQEHAMAIRGGLSASYEGLRNIFAPHCQGLNIVNYKQDANLQSAGNMALYFDDLAYHGKPEQASALVDLFRLAMPIAVFTPHGDHSLEVDFTSSNGQIYKYYHLSPEDYDAIDIRIRVEYKNGAVSYPEQTIIDSVLTQFELTNHIGRGFYPTAYFDHSRLPNVSRMVIEWSLADTTAWSSQILPATFGQKYIIAHAVVVQ